MAPQVNSEHPVTAYGDIASWSTRPRTRSLKLRKRFGRTSGSTPASKAAEVVDSPFRNVLRLFMLPPVQSLKRQFQPELNFAVVNYCIHDLTCIPHVGSGRAEDRIGRKSELWMIQQIGELRAKLSFIRSVIGVVLTSVKSTSTVPGPVIVTRARFP